MCLRVCMHVIDLWMQDLPLLHEIRRAQTACYSQQHGLDEVHYCQQLGLDEVQPAEQRVLFGRLMLSFYYIVRLIISWRCTVR